MNEKIYYSLLGAAAGDAMASATDGKSYEEIINIYGSEVRSFIQPDKDTFSGNRGSAQFTDAFSIPYYLVCGLIRNGGDVSTELGREVLKEWGKSEYFRFAGMTTKKVVNNLNNAETNDMWAYSGHLGNKLFKGHYYALSSNGSACKSFVLGLLNPNNQNGAIMDSIEITMSSHDDTLSLSGAAAIAGAVSECFNNEANVFSVVQSAIDAAESGKTIGDNRDDVWDYPGPSTARRIEYAQRIGIQHKENNAAKELREIIGCGPEVAETVPTALGLLIANKDNPIEALYSAVNIGDETCALATITGALIGALYGNIFPSNWENIINKANDINIGEISEKFNDIVKN